MAEDRDGEEDGVTGFYASARGGNARTTYLERRTNSRFEAKV